MKAIVVKVSLEVVGQTVQSCLDKMDEAAFAFFEEVGGAPWVAVDDDVKKLRATAPMSLADDQGFYYYGLRTYFFQGPGASVLTLPQHEGYRVQKGADEE